jgi:hypothetical protein
MTALDQDFGPDAYVVRYGGLGVVRGLACLLGAVAIVVFTYAFRHSAVSQGFAIFFGIIIALIGAGELRKAARREIMFAVHAGGVYFGSDNVKDNVPWNQVRAVELFTERQTGFKSNSKWRCVGVRSVGTRQYQRPGNGPAASALPQAAVNYYVDANRADVLPGADGTIRWAYRRMSGWRVSRPELAAAVARYAPAVPVIDGPDYPPRLDGTPILLQSGGEGRSRRA